MGFCRDASLLCICVRLLLDVWHESKMETLTEDTGSVRFRIRAFDVHEADVSPCDAREMIQPLSQKPQKPNT